MRLYDAIMKAADHIERHPKDFNFRSIRVPRSCGTPGCALGWVGHFVGIRGGTLSEIHVPQAIGLDGDWEIAKKLFYSRLDEFRSYWRYHSKDCAEALRLYAEKYHSHEKKELPDSVRDIFTQKAVNPNSCAV